MQKATQSKELEDARWQAVQNRSDAAMDAFRYAVVTTGVFCRPECPSRRPLRENVRFFDTWKDAFCAGFRPCKRCNPAEGDAEVQTVLRICEGLQAEGSTLAALAESEGIGESAARRLFLHHLGITPRAYQQSIRLNRWKEVIPSADGSLDAAFAAGIGSARGLYENASERLGMTPARFAKGGKGMNMRYETEEHELGTVLAAGTEKGVSFVALGTDVDEMLSELKKDYPQATLQRREDQRWMPAVIRALDHPECSEAIPLDVQATAFQARVWNALKAIPAGETRTYSGLAAALGNPSATRAVARACATNRVSILIPCHRVVGASGSLTGYRWGTERKAALLERERLAAARVR